MNRSSKGPMWHAAWWLVPLTIVWLFGTWMTTLYFQAGEPVWAVVVVLTGSVVTFGVSALVGVRRPEVLIGQLLTLATAGFAVTPFLLQEIEPYMAEWLIDLVKILGSPLSILALVAVCWVILLFPNGRHLSRGWTWVSWFLGVFVLLAAPLTTAWFLSDAVESALPQLDEVLFVVAMVPFTAAVLSLFFRYRAGSGEVRAQLRWLLFGVSIYVVFLVVGGFILEEDIVAAAFDQIFYLGIPVGIGTAVLRYRLYEIDRLISRTITYATVVGLMAAAFFGTVALVTSVLPTQDSLAVAASTLAVAALFNPLRRRIQRVVDRRFNRSQYRAEQVTEEFAAHIQESLSPLQLTDAWVETVNTHFEPNFSRVWLKDN